MAGIMKRAEEIYKALEKTMEFVVEAGKACIGVNADAEVVRDMADSRDEVCSSNGRYAIDYAIKQISSVAVEKVSDVDCLINKAIEAAEDGLAEPEAEIVFRSKGNTRGCRCDKHHIHKTGRSRDLLLHRSIEAGEHRV